MSDTIEVRLAPTRRAATLFQRRPTLPLDAVMNLGIAGSHLSKTLYGGSDLIDIDVHVVGVGAAGIMFTGVTGSVVLVDDEHHTGGLPAVQMKHGADDWCRWAETTKELLQHAEAETKPMPSAAAKLRVDRLASIQAAFGLPTLAMADVLGITRQGLYKWLDTSKDMTLQEASRQRLTAVERLARRWREQSDAPLNSVAHEPLASGRTVLEMLADEVLDEAAIAGAFDELVGKLGIKPKSLSQKMAEGGFTRRPSGRSLSDDE